MTALALALPALAFSATSWKTSNISSVRLEAGGGDGADLGVVEQVDQRLDVVAAEHGAEQFGGALRAISGHAACRHGDFREELGLDLGGVIDAGRDAVGDQVDQEGFLALGRVLQQGDQLFGLLLGQGQRRDAEGGALGDMGSIGF